MQPYNLSLKNMYRPNLLRNKLLIASALFVSVFAGAAEKNFDLPINVDSRYQFADGIKRTTLFTEDVHITQGTLSIDADEVEVIAGNDSDELQTFIARGKPASYSQTMEDGSVVKASANEIKYVVAQRTITLTGGAELKQDSTEVKGESISYNIELEQVVAQGDSSEDGRVKTTFNPRAIKRSDDEQNTNNTDENETKGEDQP